VAAFGGVGELGLDEGVAATEVDGVYVEPATGFHDLDSALFR
jgi:hypothetical protein